MKLSSFKANIDTLISLYRMQQARVMGIFSWNPLYETGIQRIDEQHKMLFKLTNDLARAIQVEERLPTLDALVASLRHYAYTHFCDEEKLMQCSTLAVRERGHHICAHKSFISKVDELASRTDLTDAEAASAFLEFLITWLVTHILRLDRRIARAVVEQATTKGKKDGSVEHVLISAIIETERRFRSLSDEAPTLIWISGPNGKRDYANKAWFDFVGIAERPASEIDWMAYIHPDDVPRYESRLADLLTSKRGDTIEFRVKRPSGEWGWVQETVNPRHTRDRCIGLIAAGADVTKIKASEAILAEANVRLAREVAERTKELEHLAATDALTGLANRRVLLERTKAEVAHCACCEDSLSILFVDIDHFKAINDSYGHATGDAVLVELSEILRTSTRKADVIGRLGGEEFIVLLIGAKEKDAFSIAEATREKVCHHKFSEAGLAVTLSIGVATHFLGENEATLIARADMAMLQAKQTGRNQCCIAASAPTVQDRLEELCREFGQGGKQAA